MSEQRYSQGFPIYPSNESIIYLNPDVIAPLGFGRLIAPQTLLVANEELAALAGDGGGSVGDVFENVSLDFNINPGGGGSGIVENDDNWGIGVDGLDVARLWAKGIRGQGVRVGIADSGMDATHPAFADLMTEHRLSGFAQFDKTGKQVFQKAPDGSVIPDSAATPTFSHPHGTHCAAVIAGQPTDGKARGVAPAVELAVTRVLEIANNGSVASIAAGLWWLTTQECDIVSLSLGWAGLHEEWAVPTIALVDAGVVVVVATGNEFGAVGLPKSRSPGNYLTSTDPEKGILVPVGAHDQGGEVWDSSGGELVDWSNVKVTQTDGTTRPSTFSNVPPRIIPSLVAPGVEIISANPGNKYLMLDGTSMATPHIAGLIALVLSQLRASKPATPPRAAADIVLAKLKDMAPPGLDARSGGGRVDNDALLKQLSSFIRLVRVFGA